MACLLWTAAQANPTCYEYWEENCQGSVRATYHELTGGNCSLTTDGQPSLSTSCVTSSRVALTQMEPGTCQRTFGSVQSVSECVPLGRRGDRDVYLYCTNAGCDRFGETCTQDKVQLPGSVKLWDACGGNDVYSDPVPADGECYKLPDAVASVRVSCLNSMYMQVEVYEDQACQYKPQNSRAPTFLQEGTQCYEFQGQALPFAMTVIEPCRCGESDPVKEDNVLKYDVVYNMTVAGSRCIEGNGLENLERRLEEETNKEVNISIFRSSLNSANDGVSWWTLFLNVRFQGVREPDLTAFQEDFTRALDDGRVLQMIETTCGSVVNITLQNGGNSITESDISTPAPASSSFNLQSFSVFYLLGFLSATMLSL